VLFNPSLGTCRLDYTIEENRYAVAYVSRCAGADTTWRLRGVRFHSGFFVALFRQTQILGRKGCNRTALELCKLLLSLDPSDPLFILLAIDYYALRAEQYAFLFRLEAEHPNATLVRSLPNLAFSLAYAQRELERSRAAPKSTNRSSSDLLQRALLAFPAALAPLLRKANVRRTVVSINWRLPSGY
jgi:hypothetical protein